MKALEGMNAKKLKSRAVAVDWVVPKEKYELSLREKGGGVEEEGGERGEVTSQSDSMISLGEKGEEEEEEMNEGKSDEARSEREEDDSSSEGKGKKGKPIWSFAINTELMSKISFW